ncbi:MAG: acyl-CoA dehydrogenase family protein [Nevskiales bacterium]
MASYQAPVREMLFVLNDVLHVNELQAIPRFAEASPELMAGVIDEAAKFIERELAPLNRTADELGCKYKDGEVVVPPGFAEAYKQYWQGGWVGLAHDAEYGGQAMPYTLSKVVGEMVCSANVAFELYVGLTQDCFEAILANGTEEQKQTYCHKLAVGEWTGTMCMTEPQAGSDVGAVKTKAIPQAGGSYVIEGQKIFITSGEHRMVDNIIHFVLARLPDSPSGVKGLSTFVVPKFLVKPDGTLGERNKVRCVSIEHKMGMHGSCTCTLAFEGANGWLVGKPNQGIQNMFVMMNLARIMVGFQGLGQCELATQNAVRYAKDRKQGKAFNGGAEIIEHPDVRRMLLHMKAITEGARVMAYETAKHADLAQHHPDAAVREAAQDWVELTTPLVKAFCTDQAVELGSMAIQVYGGHGYIREHGIEQILRDSKILCLYEGTNGIQAMDLVRRKLVMQNGRLADRFFQRAEAVLKQHATDKQMAFIVQPLTAALKHLHATTQWLQTRMKEGPNDAGAAAADYLRAFSLAMLGYNWLRMAAAALKSDDANFRAAKLATASFFATRLLPQVDSLCVMAQAGGDSVMELAAANF